MVFFFKPITRCDFNVNREEIEEGDGADNDYLGESVLYDRVGREFVWYEEVNSRKSSLERGRAKT